jgi:putative hemolysin
MLFIVLILLLICSAWFSGMEIALFSLSSAKVKSLSMSNKTNAHVLQKILRNKHRLLALLLLGNNLVNVSAASLATVLAVQKFGSAGAGIATGVLTILLLLFGEMYPKAFFQLHAEKLALLFAPLVYFLQILLWPILAILEKMLKLLTGGKSAEVVSEREFRAFSRLAVEKGVIDFEEHEMIMNVLSFDNKSAKEVMQPFYKIKVLNKEAAVDQVAYFMAKEGWSRYPLYNNNKDNIVGYVHVIDILRALNSKKRDLSVDEYLQDIIEVSPDTKIDKIFAKMRQKKIHMAVVKRKDGQTVGILTLEDLLEELVGEIEDEKD